MIVDIWHDLESIFAIQVKDLYPGIQISGLDRQSQRQIMYHVCQYAHDIEIMLEDAESGIPLYPQTIDLMIDAILADNTDGMIWVEAEIDRLVLPSLGFFSHNEEMLSIHYIMGMWTPMTLIGLFELLRWIYDLHPHIEIQMETGTAPDSWCRRFNRVWLSYLTEKVSS